MVDHARELLRQLIEDDDCAAIAKLLESSPGLRDSLNDPMFAWDMPPLAGAQSVEAAELLHVHGADYDAVGEWWAPGFFVRSVDKQVGRHLAQQGAPLTPHAAAGLGLVNDLAVMIDADPEVIHAKGGDGCTPLHFARDVDIARLLVDRGASLDARDDDHDSTPIQWLVGDAHDVVRYLLERGATPDIFVAAALGDQQLVERLVAENPHVLSLRVGRAPFPPIGYQNLGGTILQWTLGFNSFAHQYAAQKGHAKLARWMFDHSDVKTKFLVACVSAMRQEAEDLLKQHPDIVSTLDDEDLELLPRYCWETNISLEAVRLMLDVGFPMEHPEFRHGWTPLHNAAWSGEPELVELLLQRGHAVDQRDPDFGSTAIGWAIHCCVEEKRHPDADYGRVVSLLVDAGTPWEVICYPTDEPQLDLVLKPRLKQRLDGLALLGDLAGVESQLEAGKQDANLLSHALVAAAREGHLSICQRLLSAGAVNQLPPDGSIPPLQAALQKGSLELIQWMLEHGADSRELNAFGGTVWHTVGAYGRDQSIIDLLIQHGAKPRINHSSRFDRTALDVALSYSENDTAKALQRLGAKRHGE